ncbi:hypothetical protein [Streptomyces hygroscopicus]|uniref:hypothetical protein n=1 Tax=Streptomyces hygroscopicus TaxID=1912 RepID=UPI001FCB0335|nr:hypothetical protein [Streptomyces hygroscopicus]BDH09475.1 hypothetical protein HOK021_06540 [Streptomyces hygroscopicus]
MRRLRPRTALPPLSARNAHNARFSLAGRSRRSRRFPTSSLLVLPVLATLTSLALLAGCAGVEGLQSEGRARDVDAPRVLWPEYSPAPPGRDENPVALVPVPNVPRIPSGTMADANPLAVLDADIAAQGRTPPAPKAVRRPELHDITRDGKANLIMAVDLDPRTSELRVYSVRRTVVTRVLVLRGVLAGVELAAGHLVIREPTKDPRYVSVTDYVWDGHSMSLWNLTLDDARTPQTPRAGGGSP